MCCRAPGRERETREQLETAGNSWSRAGGSGSCRPAPSCRLPAPRRGAKPRGTRGHGADCGMWGQQRRDLAQGMFQGFMESWWSAGRKVPPALQPEECWTPWFGEDAPCGICSWDGWNWTQPGRATLGTPRGHRDRAAGQGQLCHSCATGTLAGQKPRLLPPRLGAGTACGRG